jgi:hypothetical protein
MNNFIKKILIIALLVSPILIGTVMFNVNSDKNSESSEKVYIALEEEGRVAGFILSRMGFSTLYIIAGIFLLPLLFIIGKVHPRTSVHTTKTNIWKSLQILWRNKNIRNITVINFVLQFFHSVKIIK